MNKIKYIFLIFIIFDFFLLFAEKNEAPHNRFNAALQYSQTSGFIPAIDILWHYNDDIFSSLYGNYYITAEKKSLEKYENSKYALFAKTFVLGSDVIGFYAAKQPALFALSAGIEYKRLKNEEFGFYDTEETSVIFDDTTVLDMVFPFVRLRVDKYSELADNRFQFVFYPIYYLLMDQSCSFNPLISKAYKTSSTKRQVPAIEISDEFLFNFKTFGGILLNGAFAFWQAKYESAVLKVHSGKYSFKKAEVKQIFLEYSASMSYIIPLEIAGTIRPKIGVGVSGMTEFRENEGRKSTLKDIGYLIIFGFYY